MVERIKNSTKNKGTSAINVNGELTCQLETGENMLDDLKEKVCESNIELFKKGIVTYTWGNASGIDRSTGSVVIKPSGVDYDCLTPEDMVVVNLQTGKAIDGKLRPSSDTDTHLELYRCFPGIGGVVHTHSPNAVSFAQAGIPIRVLGTTHADYFYGDIPCTRELTENEVNREYELNTGKVIVETVTNNGKDPMDVPGILVKNHGPFTWGKSSKEAVFNAAVLESIADMALKTIILNRDAQVGQYIIDKHYFRKHGSKSYYGQILDDSTKKKIQR